MLAAMRHTLQAITIYPELLDEYLRQAGEISFASNKDRQYTAWVNRQGIEVTCVVGGVVDASGYKIKYYDNLGYTVSKDPVSCTDSKKYHIPEADMLNLMASRFEKPIHKYLALELLATLDLDAYKAVRRIIVPADFEFESLHKVLQIVFRWRNSHLYDFAVLDDKNGRDCGHARSG
jgi:hypothetical protein